MTMTACAQLSRCKRPGHGASVLTTEASPASCCRVTADRLLQDRSAAAATPRAPSSCSLVTAGGSVPGHSVCGHRFRARTKTPEPKTLPLWWGTQRGHGPPGLVPRGRPTRLSPSWLACLPVSRCPLPATFPKATGRSPAPRNSKDLRANNTSYSTAGTWYNYLTLKGHVSLHLARTTQVALSTNASGTPGTRGALWRWLPAPALTGEEAFLLKVNTAALF